MRAPLQLFLLLASCLAACWLLNFYTRSLPTTISGIVIDWNTGRPAPFTDIRADQPNFSTVVARTDSQGRFRFSPSATPAFEFLFVGSPGYGRLLQATFGQTVVVRWKGERITGVVIPAMPATELSGHVYGSDGMPLAGCSVSAVTRDTRFSQRSNLKLQGWSTLLPIDLAGRDDPRKFWEIERVNTDASGVFTFTGLGADKYFILARCNLPPGPQAAEQLAWVPMFYPDATSIVNARELILLPGDKRVNVDFHLHREKSYSLTGKMIFSHHSAPKPWPQALYAQDLRVLRSDRSLTSFSGLAWEQCQINANAGTFHCDGLLPGSYTFYFKIESLLCNSAKIAPQSAEVIYSIPAASRHSLTVQLRDSGENRFEVYQPYTGLGGILDLGKVCESLSYAHPAVVILASGHGYASTRCVLTNYSYRTTISLPRDRYRVEAFQESFRLSGYGHLGDGSKFEALLAQNGAFVDLDAGRTIKPALPVITTGQLIGMALNSLRSGH